MAPYRSRRNRLSIVYLCALYCPSSHAEKTPRPEHVAFSAKEKES